MIRVGGRRLTELGYVVEHLRAGGWVGDRAEVRCGRICRDFLGFADAVFIGTATTSHGRPKTSQHRMIVRVIAVQVTDVTNLAARLRKVCGHPAAIEWVLAGGRAIVVGVRKTGELRIFEAFDDGGDRLHPEEVSCIR